MRAPQPQLPHGYQRHTRSGMTLRAVQTTMAGAHRKLRALVSYETSPRINRHEPAMTIATAANVVATTLRTVAPFPEAIIIITMTVIIFAELDIRIAALAINNAEQPISVSRFDTHFPTVFKCKCKSIDLSAFGRYAPPATLTELRLHSPGLRAWPATLGNAPTNIATL